MESPKHPYNILPGCGIAAYVGVLGGIFLLGATGLFFWTWTILQAGDGADPLNVTYGGTTQPFLMEPMRAAGLLGPEEVPDVFHPESYDGTTACAISGGALLRLSPSGIETLPLAAITSVEGDESRVVAHGTPTVTCYFQPGEGGDRFLRILQAR